MKKFCSRNTNFEKNFSNDNELKKCEFNENKNETFMQIKENEKMKEKQRIFVYFFLK